MGNMLERSLKQLTLARNRNITSIVREFLYFNRKIMRKYVRVTFALQTRRKFNSSPFLKGISISLHIAASLYISITVRS